MKVLKFQLLNKDAKLPIYDHKDDAGFAIYSVEQTVIAPGEIKTVSTGIASEIPQNYFVSIRDRGSMAIKGLHTLAGVFDAGYRGEWKIVLINLSKEIYKIETGDKITQGILQDAKQARILKVNKLSETKRGEGGFGSTGRK